MKITEFINLLGADFYTGVPDSLLRPLADELMWRYGLDPAHHVIAANEGNAVALAAGYHLATGRIPVVYMQNSGIGNAVNPVTSLLHPKVYAIPCIFVVGWRGEPGVHDEPQHVFQGEVTIRLLEDLGIRTSIIRADTTPDQLQQQMAAFSGLLSEGLSVAFVVQKGALTGEKSDYRNTYPIRREEAIRRILCATGDDPVFCTTGKAGRELYEQREAAGAGHDRDFLSVGSMGHVSSIALGFALQKSDRRVWCIDGDGAALMHLGAMAVIGKASPANFIHILLNNESHESVGGLPTAANTADLAEAAIACGYKHAISVETYEDLENILTELKEDPASPVFLEIKCALDSRADLGRPKETPVENKLAFCKRQRD